MCGWFVEGISYYFDSAAHSKQSADHLFFLSLFFVDGTVDAPRPPRGSLVSSLYGELVVMIVKVAEMLGLKSLRILSSVGGNMFLFISEESHLQGYLIALIWWRVLIRSYT